MGSWLEKLSGWLNLFLESSCPLCQRSAAHGLCLDCQRQVRRCQLPAPSHAWQQPLPVFAWGTYSGALKRSIATLKYNNQPQLAQPLGQWLAEAWLASPVSTARNLIVVPIPMHQSKQQERGFNQAELLAQSFCSRTRLPLKQGLVRVRATEAQFSLSPEAREQNLIEAFQVHNKLLQQPPKAVLLLDDIYTTGATARAAVTSLRQHQVSVYGLVAIAKARKTESRG